jgi:nicotinate-nucleotide adenylyltransferase
MTTYDLSLLESYLPPLGEDAGRQYRLGIMGGTFDPIHYGHLVAAEQALGALDLDLVVFMPAGMPAFKQDRKVSSGEDRFSMALLATASNPKFYCSRFEVAREGVTYTAETLKLLTYFYPENVHLYFITGADAISEIITWHDAGTIAKLAKFVGATRPGYDLDRARKILSESPYPFDVTYLEVPALAISSSYLRKRRSEGLSLRYLTPESVIGYIDKHGLYASEEEGR